MIPIVRHVSGSREKGREQTQSYDKRPYTYRQIKNATWQRKNAPKNFDYTTIADRLRTVGLGHDSQPTSVVKPVNMIQTLPLNTTDL